jgi:hypothetical protein
MRGPPQTAERGLDVVVIEFTRNEGPAPFSDAIVLTAEEYAALQPGDIDAMQEARFQAWLLAITPVPEE